MYRSMMSCGDGFSSHATTCTTHGRQLQGSLSKGLQRGLMDGNSLTRGSCRGKRVGAAQKSPPPAPPPAPARGTGPRTGRQPPTHSQQPSPAPRPTRPLASSLLLAGCCGRSGLRHAASHLQGAGLLLRDEIRHQPDPECLRGELRQVLTSPRSF